MLCLPSPPKGIARYFGVDPTLVRLATVLLVAFAGLSLWVYIIGQSG